MLLSLNHGGVMGLRFAAVIHPCSKKLHYAHSCNLRDPQTGHMTYVDRGITFKMTEESVQHHVSGSLKQTRRQLLN